MVFGHFRRNSLRQKRRIFQQENKRVLFLQRLPQNLLQKSNQNQRRISSKTISTSIRKSRTND